jgi:ubiquinone/menaquinone biosynthesis C-methylase UbiE
MSLHAPAAASGDHPPYAAAVIHQHPLAYLLGLEGVALMKAFAGEYDREFTHARFAEIRELLDRADELGDGTDVRPLPPAQGYDGWAPSYDDPDNGYFAMDESVLLPILRRLPPGVAVDAACGTGRYAAHLAALRHQVHGFDVSPGMLSIARAKVPQGSFAVAAMDALPVADASVDIMINALAMTHVSDLVPVLAEAARVLRPGGHLLVSDVRGYFIGSGLTPLGEEDPEGNVGYIPSWSHATSAYLQAALPHGFVVRACRELTAPPAEPDDPEDEPPGEPPSIWALHTWVPVAAAAVMGDRTCLVLWHFQLDPAQPRSRSTRT